jgi:serine protease Do
MNKKLRIVSTAGIIVLAVVLGGTLLNFLATAKPRKSPVIFTGHPSAADRVSFENGFAPILKNEVPAVVNVSSSKIVRTPASSVQSPLFSDPFFKQFFGNSLPKQFEVPPSVKREESLGSGVIVAPNGYILTNSHVVEGAKDIKVLLANKQEFQARVIGQDAPTDLAVLKVDGTQLPTMVFGDSSKMQVGNFVLAIGNPFGLNRTVTMGIVSATGRGGLGIESYEDFIQTDASINPGNSGGALINVQGQLVGINTAILSGGGGNEGIGFAIPANMARYVMDQILQNGKVIRAWLGVSIQPLTQDVANAFHLSSPNGALITRVDPNSPAAKSGLQPGDIILDVNGRKIDSSRALQLMIGTMRPGTALNLTVFRNGATTQIPTTLAELPSSHSLAPAAAAPPPKVSPSMRGITASNLTPALAGELKLPAGTKGVVVANVDPASRASEAGIQQGDVIQEVNRRPVSDIAGFDAAMRAADNQPILLLVERDGSSIFVVVQPK